MNNDFLLGATHKVGNFTIDASIGGNMYTVNKTFSTQNVTDFVVRDVYTISKWHYQNPGITVLPGRR